MPTFLLIETATTNCSVALANRQHIPAKKEENSGYSHAENLLVFIKELCQESSVELSSLDAIILSLGPGSYTGLRIGASAAKGLSFALDIPIIGIETLESINSSVEAQEFEGNVVPVLDARRMEVYSAVFNQNERLEETKATILDENSFSQLASTPVLIIGVGTKKCKEVLGSNPNFQFKEYFPSAVDLLRLGAERFGRNDFLDSAYFEPFYLKDFVAGKKKS